MNKIEIIPTINADTFNEIKTKLSLLESAAPAAGIVWAQIDVADGTFTKNTLWHNPRDLAFLETPLKLEFHLMISEPEKMIDGWLGSGSSFENGDSGLRRLIFHLNASKNPDFVIARCRDYAKEIGIAIGPDESLTKAINYRDKVDMFQILGVRPGMAGQKVLPETFDRVKELRAACPNHLIEIDGGVNFENIKLFIAAGANLIASASMIFNDDDIAKNISQLKTAAE